MKKMKLTITIGLYFATMAINLQAQNFVSIPDPNFKAALTSFDSNGDGLIDIDEAAAVSYLNVSNRQIKSMMGIAAFVNLKTLLCGENLLKSLNLSQNISLEYVDCARNRLDFLNLGAKPEMTTLLCNQNNLRILNLRNSPKLQTFYGFMNKFTSIAFWNCPDLEYVNIDNNELVTLNFSYNQLLKNVLANSNKLTSIDFSYNPLLESAMLSQNQIANIDLTNNIAIRRLSLGNNLLTRINLTPATSLNFINLSANKLAQLDLRQNALLNFVSVNLNPNLVNICITPAQLAHVDESTSSNYIGIPQTWTKDATSNWCVLCGNPSVARKGRITEVEKADSEDKLEKIYDAQGKEINENNMVQGMYICHYKSGRVVKIMK